MRAATREALAKPQNESQIQTAIRKRLGQEGDLVLWRNNVGKARFGPRSEMTVRYGLCPGSADLIGILRVRVQVREHLPSDYGVFFALEIKSASGILSTEQQLFGELVRRMGGFYTVVRSEDEAVQALFRARRGDHE